MIEESLINMFLINFITVFIFGILLLIIIISNHNSLKYNIIVRDIKREILLRRIHNSENKPILIKVLLEDYSIKYKFIIDLFILSEIKEDYKVIDFGKNDKNLYKFIVIEIQ